MESEHEEQIPSRQKGKEINDKVGEGSRWPGLPVRLTTQLF